MARRMVTLVAAVLLTLGMLAGPALAAGHGGGPGKAHQSIASVLKGDTASIMPCHVANPPQCWGD